MKICDSGKGTQVKGCGVQVDSIKNLEIECSLRDNSMCTKTSEQEGADGDLGERPAKGPLSKQEPDC